MGFGHMQAKHRHGHPKRAPEPIVLEKRDASSCSGNNPYVAPSMNAIVDSLQPLTITWNPACFSDVSKLNIVLSAADEDIPNIHAYTNIDPASGSYTAELKPRWWGAKQSQQLQIVILPAGDLIFQSKFVAGPIITATYTPPADGSTPAAADMNKTGADDTVTVVGGIQQSGGVTPGGKAAAVLVPLIFIGLAIAAFIKWKRSKRQQKSKTWTEKVDQRMSTISVDWKSVSAAGANAAIRSSMAVGMRGSRTSSAFAFGAIRPSSTFAVEDNASMSEKTPGARTTTGVGLRNPNGAANASTERVSRVSFAPDTRVSRVSFADSRPSGESRRTRAYHSAYIPPVPALPGNNNDDETSSNDDNSSGAMSPRQTEGAMALTPEAIRARISHAREDTRKDSMDSMMPALSMMRTGNDPTSPDDFLFHQNSANASAPAVPTPPAPAYIAPHHGSSASPSPMTPMTPVMDAVPASVMSPDEMLRAYAERKKSMNSPMSPIRTESPALPLPGTVMSPDDMLRAYAERKKSVNMGAGGHGSVGSGSGSGGMRALYNATGQLAQTTQQYQYAEDEEAAYAYSHPESTYSTASATAYESSDYNSAYNDAYAAVGLGYPSPMAATGNTPLSPKNVNNPFLPSGPVEASKYPFGHHPNGSIGVGAYGGAKYTIEDEGDEEGGGMAGRGVYRG